MSAEQISAVCLKNITLLLFSCRLNQRQPLVSESITGKLPRISTAQPTLVLSIRINEIYGLKCRSDYKHT